MTTHHTPGPWRLETGIRQDSGQTQTEVWAGPTSRIARIPHSEVFASDNADANARLIAAAPDLLAALRAMLEHGTRAEWDDDILASSFKLPVMFIRDARTAIAKAEEGS